MIPYFDAHCDTIVASRGSLMKNGGHLDAERLSAFSPAAQIFAVCCPEDMPGGYKKYLPVLRAQIEKSGMALCLSAEDIRNAASAGRTAALMAAEGAEHFGCSIGGLKSAYDMGVRSVNLTWNFDNALSGAAAAGGAGLTAAGREFVTAAQNMGVILDMSHLSRRGFWDVLEIAVKPVYASHSDSLAVNPGVKRNLSDEQFTALAESGGGAGINLCPDFLGLGRDLDAVCAHIEHYLELGGEKAVFLGTDFDGVDELPAGIGGVQDMPRLWEALLRLNYPESLVRDIFYNNLLEILGRAL